MNGENMGYKYSNKKNIGNINVWNMHHWQEDLPKKAVPIYNACYRRKASSTKREISLKKKNEDQNGQRQTLQFLCRSKVKGPLNLYDKVWWRQFPYCQCVLKFCEFT